MNHKNDNLNVNEDFVIFLTSKLITCFIDGFTSGMKSQSIIYLLIGSAPIYWISDLEGEVHSIWDCSQAAFKNARAIFFSKLDGAGSNFQSRSKMFMEGYPSPDLTPPIVRRGGLNVHHVLVQLTNKLLRFEC